MPMSEPLKVSISPKAMRTEWWISANGGQRKPTVSIMHPTVHNAIAVMSWNCFMEPRILSPTDFTDFSRIWVDPKIVEYYRKLFKIYLGNKNTLRYKNFKKSMRSFCFCPNECNSLHWWAKQKEILYYNEDNLDPWELFKLSLPKSYTPRWRHSPT